MSAYCNPWMTIGLKAWALNMEAATVMGLRTMKLAAGGAAADTEAQRMVNEKLEAAWQLQVKLMTGALGATPAKAATRTLSHYRRSVRANRRRLSKI